MALLKRKTIILAKIEGIYGTDAVPTGSANAILARNVTLTPQDGDTVSRDLIRPYLGNSPQLPGSIRATLDLEVEIAGSGTAGTAPGYGPLLRACGMGELTLAAPVTGTAAAGSATTATLAAGASAVDGAYKGMRLDVTGGAGSGQYATIKDYVGSTKVATFQETLTTPLTATSQYSIGSQVSYCPVSTGFEGVSIYVNIDGVLHKMLGCRGTVALSLNAKAIPVFKFKFTGLYQTVTDTAAPTPTYTLFQQPLASNTTNTPQLSLHGVTPVLQSLDLDLANQIVHRALIGTESVLLTDRKGAGTISFEATTVATKDWWTIAKNATLGPLYVMQGTVAGNKVGIAAPNVQIVKPTYQDADGVAMLNATLSLNPSSAGNDELMLAVA